MLTARQQELLDFLRKEQHRLGVMPSSREVQKHFGFASQTAAMDLLRALERKGSIRRLPGKARAVILSAEDETSSQSRNSDSPFIEVPIYGNIAAGMPQDVGEEIEGTVRVDFASMGISRNSEPFALKVRGDSMVGAHILEGDLVILERREPRAGDVVAALIDGESTLKRFLTKQGTSYLKAENASYPDLIPVRELSVQGVMVGLIRRHVA